VPLPALPEALLDRLMHHGHLLKFEGKSWRLKEAAARVAKRASYWIGTLKSVHVRKSRSSSFL